MQIQFIINGRAAVATLEDNPTSRDFVSQLPLTLRLDDYAGTEKIAYPPRKLTTYGAPDGLDPKVGDITYYAPWGNLALFYRDFGYASGLIRLGHFRSGVELLQGSGSLEVRIEKVD